MSQEQKPPSKYHVRIGSEWVDVYAVIRAFRVTDPGIQHAIKKLLLPGERGAKGEVQDLEEAVWSVQSAIAHLNGKTTHETGKTTCSHVNVVVTGLGYSRCSLCGEKLT